MSENIYERYEQMKADWISEHPDATPIEYMQAIQEIARKLGI